MIIKNSLPLDLRKVLFTMAASLLLTGLGLQCSAQTDETQADGKKIATLERKYFQHDFSKENLEHRLTRLEKFTFGENHKGSISDRLAYIESTLKSDVPSTKAKSDTIETVRKTMAPAARPSSSNNFPSIDRTSTKAQAPTVATETGNTGNTPDNYPHITALENEILGQNFSGQPVEDRLTRMEKKAFGSQSNNPDLSSRTDLLEQYAQVHLHQRPFALRPDMPSVANIGSGMTHIPTTDEIEAKMPTPPSSHARMLTRIAWCEMHTFGKTYPEMHLLQRLHQLNARLFPQEHKKDIELMDHVDSIVKKVVMLEHPPIPAS